jgi:hypothetical protein
MATLKPKSNPSSAEIYQDLLLISAQLGEAVVCMIAAKSLFDKLQPGEWEKIKSQLIPTNIKNELAKIKSEGGK